MDDIEADVKFRCQQRLAGRVDGVVTSYDDHDHLLAVGCIKGKMRHAVSGKTIEAVANPVAFADRLSDVLIAWLDRLDSA